MSEFWLGFALGWVAGIALGARRLGHYGVAAQRECLEAFEEGRAIAALGFGFADRLNARLQRERDRRQKREMAR